MFFSFVSSFYCNNFNKRWIRKHWLEGSHHNSTVVFNVNSDLVFNLFVYPIIPAAPAVRPAMSVPGGPYPYVNAIAG